MQLIRGNRSGALLALILVFAAVARCVGLGWALPHTYEEATPLRVAVGMWGWQNNAPVSLNPGFFNYPSLTIYLHFLVQGLAFLFLKISGAISSAGDWQGLFITNPTAQFLAARSLGVIFGVLTVLYAWRIGVVLAGTTTGLAAAAFLATSPYHIARSQMVEVDVPLAFFAALSLHAMILVARDGRSRDYFTAGIAAGLAASCKYTGAILLLPLLWAHFIAWKGGRSRGKRTIWTALFLMMLAFVLTSPYVLLDWDKFRADLSIEQQHMELGHFGVGGPAWKFYGRSAATVLGAPVLLLAFVGLWRRFRDTPALWSVPVLFVIAYMAIILSWSMKADRYLLPILAPVLVCTAAGAGALASMTKRRTIRQLVFAGLVASVIILNVFRLDRFRDASHFDARADAERWIEKNIPAGSYIVSEKYGPDLVEPALLLQLTPTVRAKVIERWKGRPVFAFTSIPMYQAKPERSDVFYDPRVYPEADYVVTSSQIRGRYEREKSRFAVQLAFYDYLESRCRELRRFGREEGPQLILYQVARPAPFASRRAVAPPPAIGRDAAHSSGVEAGLYFSIASNYEYFRHPQEAAASYLRALQYGTANQQLLFASAAGYARCLMHTGKEREAAATLAALQAKLEDNQLKTAIGKLIVRLRSVKGN